jgi:hypothetical protein
MEKILGLNNTDRREAGEAIELICLGKGCMALLHEDWFSLFNGIIIGGFYGLYRNAKFNPDGRPSVIGHGQANGRTEVVDFMGMRLMKYFLKKFQGYPDRPHRYNGRVGRRAFFRTDNLYLP